MEGAAWAAIGSTCVALLTTLGVVATAYFNLKPKLEALQRELEMLRDSHSKCEEERQKLRDILISLMQDKQRRNETMPGVF